MTMPTQGAMHYPHPPHPHHHQSYMGQPPLQPYGQPHYGNYSLPHDQSHYGPSIPPSSDHQHQHQHHPQQQPQQHSYADVPTVISNNGDVSSTAATSTTTASVQDVTPLAPAPTPKEEVDVCRTCGVNVPNAMKQVESARQQLQLYQEKLQVEQALLRSDKRNLKRRLQAARAAQQRAAVEREQHWAQTATAQQEQQAQQQDLQNKLEKLQQESVQTQTELQRKIDQLQTQLEELELTAKNEHGTAPGMVSTDDKNSMHTQYPREEEEEEELRKKNESLRQQLEDKQTAIDSLEMELLELERERDENGGGGGGGGTLQNRTTSNEVDECPHCAHYPTQVANLQKQLQQVQIQNQQLRATHEQWEQERDRTDTVVSQEEVDRVREALLVETSRAANLQEKVERLQRERDSAKQQQQTAAAHVPVDSKRLQELERENQRLQQQVASLLQQQQQQTTSSAVVAKATESAVAKESNNNTHRRMVMEYEWNGFTESGNDDTNGKDTNDDQDEEKSPFAGIYTGWVDDSTNLPDGRGTLRCDDGAIWDCTWSNGRPHGHGILATIEGDVYHGTWVDGEKHSTIATSDADYEERCCVHVFSDGRVYRGTYVNDTRQGEGIMTWPYGAHYQGTFENDKRNGHGEYHYADGRYYVGSYHHDRPHGYGVLKSEDGTVIYDGQWEYGEFVG